MTESWTRPERDAYLAEWGRGLREELVVQVGGEPVPVAFTDAYLQPTGEVVAADGAVEIVGHFVIPGGGEAPVTIQVRDGMRVEIFDRTDFTFRARDGATLQATGLGSAPAADAAQAARVFEQFAVSPRQPYPGEFFAVASIPEAPAAAIAEARPGRRVVGRGSRGGWRGRAPGSSRA